MKTTNGKKVLKVGQKKSSSSIAAELKLQTYQAIAKSSVTDAQDVEKKKQREKHNLRVTVVCFSIVIVIEFILAILSGIKGNYVYSVFSIAAGVIFATFIIYEYRIYLSHTSFLDMYKLNLEAHEAWANDVIESLKREICLKKELDKLKGGKSAKKECDSRKTKTVRQ